MNCVAIPPSEDKRNAAAASPTNIIHSEVTLTTPIIDSSLNGSLSGSNKSQSLQRTTTTHLYCRSLEKDAAALAIPHRRTSNSRGFASCLRGERDDAYLDYQQRAIQYEHQQQQQQQQMGQQQYYSHHQHLDDSHPSQMMLQTSICSSTGSGSNYDTTTGRSK